MDFELTPRARESRARLPAFVDEVVAPGTLPYAEQVHASGDDHFTLPSWKR